MVNKYSIKDGLDDLIKFYVKNMNKLKIGYWPNSSTFDTGDRRRCFYAEIKK